MPAPAGCPRWSRRSSLPPSCAGAWSSDDTFIDALDVADDASLTLVAAPAGYGKTTAVRAWCSGVDAALAWVTLDVDDNDPVRLWWYVATAVDRVRRGLGQAALRRLSVPGSSIEDAVDELMNGIAALREQAGHRS